MVLPFNYNNEQLEIVQSRDLTREQSINGDVRFQSVSEVDQCTVEDNMLDGAFKDTNFSISNKFAANNAEKTLTARLNEEEQK